jgi:hypothetical protein
VVVGSTKSLGMTTGMGMFLYCCRSGRNPAQPRYTVCGTSSMEHLQCVKV